MGNGIFTVQVPQGLQVECSLDDLGILQSLEVLEKHKGSDSITASDGQWGMVTVP